ncbi:uncharacterized protein E5676_scaffold21G001990 [Cucumis melo var. makuwa]|uniref:Uncharacterized protein n=1 Tax=Cucumis melo var. makuwa TaxID=1194695 RepID=A0A5D3CZL6_CUCMM|nr:uncharacterized protein E5676_scaffold21G001990 [Cucumis melo var. makuwa]
MVSEWDIEETLDDQALDGTLVEGTIVDISAPPVVDARISDAMDEWFWRLQNPLTSQPQPSDNRNHSAEQVLHALSVWIYPYLLPSLSNQAFMCSHSRLHLHLPPSPNRFTHCRTRHRMHRRKDLSNRRLVFNLLLLFWLRHLLLGQPRIVVVASSFLKGAPRRKAQGASLALICGEARRR